MSKPDRAFADRSGAARVVLLVDPGDGTTATMLDCAPGGAVELTEGDTTFAIPAHTPVDATPRHLPELRPPPATAIAIDPASGELEAPLGRAVLALAAAFGGRSVATADFATRDPALPITIAAREGEPLLLAAGDRRFVLPEGVV